MSALVGITKLFCSQCAKQRTHETLYGLAMCLVCNTQRSPDDLIEIERFID